MCWHMWYIYVYINHTKIERDFCREIRWKMRKRERKSMKKKETGGTKRTMKGNVFGRFLSIVVIYMIIYEFRMILDKKYT